MNLIRGHSPDPSQGACWMDACSYYARETWSDHPACVPETIREIAIRANDTLTDDIRESVIGPHLFAPIGADPSEPAEQERAEICAYYAVHVFAPLAFRAIGMREWAQRLRRAPRHAWSVECKDAYAIALDAAADVLRVDPCASAAYAASHAAKAAYKAEAAAHSAAHSGDAAAHSASKHTAFAAASSAAAHTACGADSQARIGRLLLALTVRLCRVGRPVNEVDPVRAAETVRELTENGA